MLTTNSPRGDISPENIDSLKEGDVYSEHDVSGEDWVGEIVAIPHPNSGHMGKSMARVVDVETVQMPHVTNQSAVMQDDAEREYEDRPTDKLITEDVLIGCELTIIQKSHPRASLVGDGASYSVYGVQHKNGRGEWNEVTHPPSDTPWGHNPYAVDAIRERYDGNEKVRVVKKTVTYHRESDADPSDTDAYNLEYSKTPVVVDQDELRVVEQPS